jgi:carboxyl-terminal processing protease
MLKAKRVVVVLAVLGCLLAWSVPAVTAGDHLEVIRQVIEVVQSEYYREVDTLTLIRGALKGIMDAVDDRHSSYMPPAEYASFWEVATGQYVGIGITFETVDAGVQVTQVFQNTPAAKVGILVGDVILKANDKELKDLTTAEIRSLLQSAEEPIALAIDRNGTILMISVKAEVIHLPSAEWKMLESGFAYIKILQFGEHLNKEVTQAMLELADAPALVLDLRGCPGGLLESVVDVAHHFVPAGPLMILQSRGGQEQVVSSEGPGPKKPLVVLVDGRTASAAEILAAAIQDTKSGIIMGARTYGKGVAQSVYTLSESMGGIKVTSMRFLSPLGNSHDGTGISPDVWADPINAYFPPHLAETIPLTRELRRGMSGSDVTLLQKALAVLGHFNHTPTGYFGPVTESAVRSFQQESGLAVSGRAARDTLIAINQRLVPAPIPMDHMRITAEEYLRGVSGR